MIPPQEMMKDLRRLQKLAHTRSRSMKLDRNNIDTKSPVSPVNFDDDPDMRNMQRVLSNVKALKREANAKNLNATDDKYTFNRHDRKELSKKLMEIVRILEKEEIELGRLTHANRSAGEKVGGFIAGGLDAGLKILTIMQLIQFLAPSIGFLGNVAGSVLGKVATVRAVGVINFVKSIARGQARVTPPPMEKGMAAKILEYVPRWLTWGSATAT